MRLFHDTCEQTGMVHGNSRIFAYLRAFEDRQEQLRLF